MDLSLSRCQTREFRAKTNSMYKATGGCIFHEPDACKQNKAFPNGEGGWGEGGGIARPVFGCRYRSRSLSK